MSGRRTRRRSRKGRGVTKKRRTRQRGGKLDLQKALAKTGIEFHWPGYQYMGPGTHLEKRLKRGDPGKTVWIALVKPTTSTIATPHP